MLLGKTGSAIFKVPPLVIALVADGVGLLVVGAAVVGAAVVGADVAGLLAVGAAAVGADVVGVASEQAPKTSTATSKVIIRMVIFFTLIPPP